MEIFEITMRVFVWENVVVVVVESREEAMEEFEFIILCFCFYFYFSRDESHRGKSYESIYSCSRCSAVGAAETKEGLARL